MKFIFWVYLVVTIFSFPSICFSKQPDPNKWAYVSGNFYYNKTSITKSSNIISVWTYQDITGDDRKKMVEYGLPIKFQNVNHFISLMEFDFKKMLIRMRDTLCYDDEGNVLDHEMDQRSEWKAIPPNSKFETLYKKLVTQEVETPKVIHGILDSKVWESYDNNSYYNKTNLTKSSNIISVWTCSIITDDGRKKLVELMKIFNLKESVKYQNYDHQVGFLEVDCKNKLYKIENSMNYDDKGNVLNSYIYNKEWGTIMPNSVYQKLYQKVCVTQ